MDPNGLANQTISFPQISKKQFWSSHSCWWNPRIFMVKPCFSPWFSPCFPVKNRLCEAMPSTTPRGSGKTLESSSQKLSTSWHRLGWQGWVFPGGKTGDKSRNVWKVGCWKWSSWYMMIFSVFIWYPIHSNSNRTSSDFFPCDGLFLGHAPRAFMGSFRGPHGRSWKRLR